MDLMLAVFLVVAGLPASYCQLSAADISPVGTFYALLDPGTNSTFSCTVKEAAALVWRIDEIPAEDERIRNRGITMNNVETLIDNNLQGNISIPNAMVNNQSRVVCVAKNIPGIEPPEINSDQGVLQLVIQESGNLLTPLTTFGDTGFRTRSNSMAMSSGTGSITLCVTTVILKLGI